VSEAARRIGTYPTAINRWIAKGELEAFRVEGKVFRFVDAEQVFPAGEVRSWLAGEWYLEGQDPERFLESLPEGWLDEDSASIAWEAVLAVKRAGIEEELRRLKEQERYVKKGKRR
jgi:hypothetical protein